MLPVDGALKLLAAILAAGFAAAVLIGRPRDAAARFLAVFLLLIAGNQGIEGAATLGLAAPSDRAAAAAALFAILDPLFLFAFASAQREETRAAPRLSLGLVLGAAAVLALVRTWGLGAWPSAAVRDATEAAIALYTAWIYLALLHWAIDKEQDGRMQRPGEKMMLVALAVAALPTVVRLVDVLWYPSTPRFDESDPVQRTLVLATGVAAFAIGGASALRRARQEETRRLVTTTVWVVAGLTLATKAFDLNGILQKAGWVPILPELQALGRSSAALRWLAFVCLVSIATLRYGNLDVPAERRTIAARVLISAFFLGVGTVALLMTGAQANGTLHLGLAGLLGVMLVSHGAKSTIQNIASRVYGIPLAADLAGREETYRRATLRLAAEGQLVDDHPELAGLRAQLGIPIARAAAIAREVSTDLTVRILPGETMRGRYRVVSFLGRGAAGRAALAEDLLLARRVVLKEILTSGPEDRARGLSEARLAAAVEHARVIAIHDVIPLPDGLVLVLEYAEGGSLEERLRANGAPTAEQGLQWLEDVVEGLAAIHGAGLVHRDVAARNVLLDAHDRAKLADFGIAAVVPVTRPLEEPADEQWPRERRVGAGATASAADDVHAVGLLAERLLPRAPPEIARVLERAKHPDPARRWGDARALRDALRRARAQAQ